MEFCNHQGIAFNAHRDHRTKHADYLDSNPGKSQALLKVRCPDGDGAFAEHLSKCGRNTTYHSKTAHNEIMQTLGGIYIYINSQQS